jgi:hypothetical protein
MRRKMTQLQVKSGRKYYYKGKDRVGGEIVEIEDERHVKLLTMPKGPLESLDARKPADLPKAAYQTANMKADEAPLALSPETAPARRRSRNYHRSDMQAEE